MQQVEQKEAAQTERPQKKPYTQPQLQRHGLVEQVTQGGVVGGGPGGASGLIS